MQVIEQTFKKKIAYVLVQISDVLRRVSTFKTPVHHLRLTRLC